MLTWRAINKTRNVNISQFTCIVYTAVFLAFRLWKRENSILEFRSQFLSNLLRSRSNCFVFYALSIAMRSSLLFLWHSMAMGIQRMQQVLWIGGNGHTKMPTTKDVPHDFRTILSTDRILYCCTSHTYRHRGGMSHSRIQTALNVAHFHTYFASKSQAKDFYHLLFGETVLFGWRGERVKLVRHRMEVMAYEIALSKWYIAYCSIVRLHVSFQMLQANFWTNKHLGIASSNRLISPSREA